MTAHEPSRTGPQDSVDAIVAGWQTLRQDLDVSPVEVVTRLSRVRAILETEMDAVFAEHGLSIASFSALAAISRLDTDSGVTQVRLMRELQLTSGTISVRIDRLVADGLAERRPDPDDRRGTRISLTALGREVFERAAPDHLENERRLLSALGPEEQQMLASLLRRLLIDLEPSRPGIDGPARRLGLTLMPAHASAGMRKAVGLPEVAGLLVRSVAAQGPAGRGGVVEGDVVCGVNGSEVRSMVDLHEALEPMGARPTVIDLVRGVGVVQVVLLTDAGSR